MSNPSGPDENVQPASGDDPPGEPQTEAMATSEPPVEDATPAEPAERRFTAPSPSDAGSTQIIDTGPPTEILSVSDAPAGSAASAAQTERFAQSNVPGPQLIPPRTDAPAAPRKRRSWGWVIALVLVIAALVAVAILGTVLLTRDEASSVSQEDRVRSTIQNFDTAIQKGDLATLRSITCGETADSYVKYNDAQWKDIHARVAAARQYPVVASIDQVVVNDGHAEANVTSFMAFDPATRSTRSFDLEFRDEQWKICQAPS
jgi:hypothetical protein